VFGVFPFVGKDLKETRKKIKEAKLEFKEGKEVSSEVKTFI
jgi:hypothetical protein